MAVRFDMTRVALLWVALGGTGMALLLGACASDGANNDSQDGGGSCTLLGCAAGERCDASHGTCIPGCDEPLDCGPGLTCEPATGTCICEAGTHACDGACVSNSEVSSCGDRCAPCAPDRLGEAGCVLGQCVLECVDGAQLCEEECRPCPAGAEETACEGPSCVATACGAGRALCDGQCPVCPAGSTATQCQGQACVASSCQPGRKLCAGQCPSCPTGATATSCAGATCVAEQCAAGRRACNGQCPLCPMGATATACAGNTCVATACQPGQMLCNGQCRDCAPGDRFCCKEPVDPTFHTGEAHALALDTADQPVVAYYDANGKRLKLARGGAGGFRFQVLDQGGDVGMGVSLAVDGAGTAHVGYVQRNYPYAVKYARVPPTGAAQIEMVEQQGLIEVGDTSIAVDAQGGVHLGYYASGDAHYGYRPPTGSWQVRQALQDGRQVSLALSGQTPHLIGSSNPSIGVPASVLSYGWLPAGAAPNTSFTAGPRVNSTVGISVFHEASLAVVNGHPSVAWVHPNFRNLQLSRLEGGSWMSQVLDDDVANQPVLRTFGDQLRIAYKVFRNNTADFRPTYAEATQSGFTFQTIDTQMLSPGAISLAIDSTGRPHVTLFDRNPNGPRLYYIH